MIDHAAADMADHDGVLLADADAAGDSLLVDDVFADACAMEDLAVQAWACVEDLSELCPEIPMSARNESATRVLDDAVG